MSATMQILRYEEHAPRDQIRATENPIDDEGGVEVLIQFRGGEVWAAVNIAAREHGITPASALTACVAYGLWALGYEVAIPALIQQEVAA